jgi:hypothetical protein
VPVPFFFFFSSILSLSPAGRAPEQPIILAPRKPATRSWPQFMNSRLQSGLATAIK